MPPDRAEDEGEPGDLPGVPRPRETLGLVGHDAAEAAFSDAMSSGRLHHAWLIGGPPGIGKATLAYRVARRLLVHPAGDGPAGLAVRPDHRVVGQVARLSHPNLVVLRRHRAPGAKALPTRISVDAVRGALDLFATTAADSGWRVCILDSADDLNANAANALLKVLEEPPPRALFLIVAHRPGRLLPTIRSRCRALALRALSPNGVHAAIAALPPPFAQPATDALERAVAQAEGSVGQALAQLDPRIAAVADEVEALLAAAPPPDWRRILKLADTLAQRESEAAFAVALERFSRFVAREVDRRRQEGPARLLPLVEAHDRITAAVRESAAYNLDRRPLVLSLFEDLAAARGA